MIMVCPKPTPWFGTTASRLARSFSPNSTRSINPAQFALQHRICPTAGPSRSLSSSNNHFASSSSSSPLSSSLRENLELREDQPNADPTLEYLDSLNPNFKWRELPPQADSTDKERRDAYASRVWNKTHDAVISSFTRDQLVKLAKQAKLKGSYSPKVKKGEFVRRILIQRFGLVDLVERQEKLRLAERDKVDDFIPFEPAQVFLLLAKRQSSIRNQTSQNDVKILANAPSKKDKRNHGLGLWIRGKQAGNHAMKAWVQQFKQEVQEREETVSLPSIDAATSSTALEHLLPQLTSVVSRSSRCFVEAQVDQGSQLAKIKLHYIDTQDAERAMSLLRQLVSEQSVSARRVGLACYSDDTSLRRYSMLPFVPNQPLPWLCQAQHSLDSGASADITFRVALIPDHDSLVGLAENPEKRTATTSWNGEASEDPIKDLLPGSAIPEQASLQPSQDHVDNIVSLVFGHALFRNGSRESATEAELEDMKLADDPLSSPRPGIWPLQDFLGWLRDSGNEGKQDLYDFIPASPFRSQKEGQQVASWLDRKGWKKEGNSLQELLHLRYRVTDTGPDSHLSLNIEIVRDASWKLKRAYWTTQAEADALFPEKPIDLRLHSASQVELTDLAIFPELDEYIKGLQVASSDETLATAPEEPLQMQELESSLDHDQLQGAVPDNGHTSEQDADQGLDHDLENERKQERDNADLGEVGLELQASEREVSQKPSDPISAKQPSPPIVEEDAPLPPASATWHIDVNGTTKTLALELSQSILREKWSKAVDEDEPEVKMQLVREIVSEDLEGTREQLMMNLPKWDPSRDRWTSLLEFIDPIMRRFASRALRL